MYEGITIRRAGARDGESVSRFLRGLSLKSRYRRFFSPFRHVTPAMLRDMITTTPTRHVLLALDGETVVGHVIAVGNGEHTVDIGIVVADAYRLQGIGSRLVHDLTEALAAIGCTGVRCEVLSENYFVLDWLRRLAPDLSFERSGAILTVHARLVARLPGQVVEGVGAGQQPVEGVVAVVQGEAGAPRGDLPVDGQ